MPRTLALDYRLIVRLGKDGNRVRAQGNLGEIG